MIRKVLVVLFILISIILIIGGLLLQPKEFSVSMGDSQILTLRYTIQTDNMKINQLSSETLIIDLNGKPVNMRFYKLPPNNLSTFLEDHFLKFENTYVAKENCKEITFIMDPTNYKEKSNENNILAESLECT